MLPNPQTLYAIRDTDRRAWLAEAARARVAAQPMTDPRPSPSIPARRRLGAALVAMGTRLQGARTADPAAPARPAIALGPAR